jgi:protein N-terminal methyltransferase
MYVGVIDNGVLGGYGRLTPLDVRDSNMFLDQLQVKLPGLRFDRAADCGAGIGRVTKHLLLPRCGHVDLYEQSPRLTAAVPEYVGPPDSERVTCFVEGLQVRQHLHFTST